MSRRMGLLTALLALLAAAIGITLFDDGEAQAARISDIRNTRHNLSASGKFSIKASSETEVCVFCHTPHAASQGMKPLWNKTPATGAGKAVYTLYNSNSLDAAADGVASLGEPDGSSKLCLSCHDGTVAIGSVNVLRGQTNQTIAMSGNVTTMPTSTSAVGLGVDTGYTRVLGTDLSNDHPISFTYDATRAQNDGELYQPTMVGQAATRTTTKRGVSVSIIGSRGPGAENKPIFPLEDGKMQCATCHDPHIRDDAADATGWTSTEGPIKFLRESRLQQRTPAQGQYSSGQDILCLGCHNKEGWAQSAHAVAQNMYSGNATTSGSATNIRQFPTSTTVQGAACLNCHDTHTVKGAKRLLRDGTDGTVSGQTYKSGGNQATEQTCYACHAANGGGTVGTNSGSYPPNVQTDFVSTSYHMPIAQGGTTESHDIGTTDGNLTGNYLTTQLTKATDHLGANGIEGRTQLGNRHVECPDCHNPHRVLKNEVFNGSGGTTTGHHKHDETSTTQVRSNLASGALRGAFGVEPDYGTEASVTWGTGPSKYKPKFGDPGSGTDTTVTASYVTREYQICLKCHSSYAYGASPPTVGPSINFNGLSGYTDQAMEFASPTNDQGESGFTGNNHRSWHPVRRETSRSTTARAMGTTTTNWLKPWRNGVGTQTMYCTDCHGSATAAGSTVPTSPAPWGPHGSTNPFILKGPWGNVPVGAKKGSGIEDGICFRCHDSAAYAGGNNESGSGYRSGFCCGTNQLGNKTINLHLYHVAKIANPGNKGSFRCTFCHVAVPHGWKNKALLVNLNSDDGGIEVPAGSLPYTKSPYFYNATLKVVSFAQSGQWEVTNCGNKGIKANSPSDNKSWMVSTCGSRP